MKFTQAMENYNNVFSQVGKNKWITNTEIVWYVDYDNRNEFRVIPKGFPFNGGNSPCFTHCIVDDDDYPFAFCGHDFDYSGDTEYIILDLNNLSDTFKKMEHLGSYLITENKIKFFPDRKFADLILLDTIKVEGLSKTKAKLTYLGIRLGGRKNFTPNKHKFLFNN